MRAGVVTVALAAVLVPLAWQSAGGDARAAQSARPPSRAAALALMKQRHDNFERMGAAMKASTRSLRSARPDWAVLRKSAVTFATLAPKLPSWFPAGTGPEVGKTDARPAIWQQPEEFAARARDFAGKATAFRSATQRGDLAATRTAFAALGKSCKACHDKFRTEDEH